MKKNICVFTGTRAEYGLLKPLMNEIKKIKDFNLQLIVSGTHLSYEYGFTYKEIEKDGFKIDKKIEILLSSTTEIGISKAMGLGMISYSEAIDELKPDLMIILGDRYESFAAASVCLISKIPIVHLYGGEATFGLIDDAIRHSITKMASLHFASIEIYAKRIIQMGENPERVFVVGALGIDNILNMNLMTINELSNYTNLDFNDPIALMTYHPVTLDNHEDARNQIINVLNALLEKKVITLITMSNSDTAGNIIHEEINRYTKLYPNKFKFVKSLGQRGYLTAMKYAKFVIGNSSSGIIESSSFKIPVVNIGDRQNGRFKPKNIIDCECSKENIVNAINKAISKDFLDLILNLNNPFGDGHSAQKIVEIMQNINFNDKSKYLKKGFYDIIF